MRGGAGGLGRALRGAVCGAVGAHFSFVGANGAEVLLQFFNFCALVVAGGAHAVRRGFAHFGDAQQAALFVAVEGAAAYAKAVQGFGRAQHLGGALLEDGQALLHERLYALFVPKEARALLFFAHDAVGHPVAV